RGVGHGTSRTAREQRVEPASTARRIFDPDRAAVPLDDGARYRESQAHSLAMRAGVQIRLEEALEDPLLVRVRYARPSVLYGEQQTRCGFVGRLPPGGHGIRWCGQLTPCHVHRRVVRRKLDSVAEQVRDDVAYAFRVA